MPTLRRSAPDLLATCACFQLKPPERKGDGMTAQLHVPEPPARPGSEADFSGLQISAAGEVRQPPPSSSAETMRDLAYSLVRVLDTDDAAKGPWAPPLDLEAMKSGLRAMQKTRVYDERMMRMQRRGQTSFYMQCTG